MVPPVTIICARTVLVGAISRWTGDDRGREVPVLDVERSPWGPVGDDMTITIDEFLVFRRRLGTHTGLYAPGSTPCAVLIGPPRPHIGPVRPYKAPR